MLGPEWEGRMLGCSERMRAWPSEEGCVLCRSEKNACFAEVRRMRGAWMYVVRRMHA